MGSGANGNRRRLVPLELNQHYLRERLFALYRHDPRYLNIIAQDLRPAWLPVYRQIQSRQEEAAEVLSKATGMPLEVERDWVRRGTNLELEHLDRELEWLEARPEEWQELDAYRTSLYERGVAALGLFHGGRPAGWAASYVHSDVASDLNLPVLSEPNPLTMHETFGLNLRMDLHPLSGSVRARTADGEAGTDLADQPLPDIFDRRTIAADAGRVFDRWEELKAEVLKFVDTWLADVRANYEEVFPAWRNEASLRQQDDDLPCLYRALFHRDPIPDKLDRERLRKLAQVIGVDFPRPAPK